MYNIFFKRLIDIILSIIGLPIFFILFFIFGFLIKKEDGGPILYKTDRIGENSKIFEMYKFRTMKVNAPNILNKDGSTYNSENDPRVTKIGKFLRETSIDEIPQILNVLKGDMSFIGPRASMDFVLDTFKEDEIDKMKVKPGITGYTQAYFRNNISNREKRLKDVWYAKNISLKLDVIIIFQTINTVINKRNIYTNKKNTKDYNEN